MSKSAVPPLEWLAPTGNSTGGWPVCPHPSPLLATPPAGSTAVLLLLHHQLLATLTQPSALKLIVPCYRKPRRYCPTGRNMILLWQKKKVARQHPKVTFSLPEAWLHGQSLVSFSFWLILCFSQPPTSSPLGIFIAPCLVFFVPVRAPSLTSSAALWPTSVTLQDLATFQLLWSVTERRYCLQLKEFSLKLRGFAQRTTGNTKIKLENVEVESRGTYSHPTTSIT